MTEIQPVAQMTNETSEILFMIVETDHLAIFNNIHCKNTFTPITKVLYVSTTREQCIVEFVDTLSTYEKSKYDIKYESLNGTLSANIYDITKQAGWIKGFRLNVLTKTISICECLF